MARVLICIGCDEYDSLTPLGGAHKDAESVYQALIDDTIGAYDKASSRLLLSPKLSEVRLALLEVLFHTEHIDTFTFFFAGHGEVRAGAYYLCVRDTDERMLSATALGISDLFSQINESQPRQSNIIIDACQAGGVVADLHALLKPELIGGAQTPGVTIYATSASDEYSADTEEGGAGTLALMACVTGSQIVQTTQPTLDLLEVGKMASALVPREYQQTPVLWGLNLYGEARFCKNVHYNAAGAASVPVLTGFAVGTAQYEAVRSNAGRIWREYFSVEHDFKPLRFLSSTIPTLRLLSGHPDDLSSFVRGIADAFADRARDSADIFCLTELYASCIVSLLPYSAGFTAVNTQILSLGQLVGSAAQAALRQVKEQIEQNKFALLSLGGGFADLYYLPLRVTRIFGWVGALHIIAGETKSDDLFDETDLRSVVSSILAHYHSSTVVVSDEQAPYLLAFMKCCVDRGWHEEGEAVFGMAFNSYVTYQGRISASGIDTDRVFEFLSRRAANEFDDAYDIVAQPDEVLPVILMAAHLLGFEELIDQDLNLLDHITFNIFIPASHLEFGESIIRKGVNHTAQVGHGVWKVTDFIDDWQRNCLPMLNADRTLDVPAIRIGAVLAAMLFPDRCPWFILADR